MYAGFWAATLNTMHYLSCPSVCPSVNKQKQNNQKAKLAFCAFGQTDTASALYRRKNLPTPPVN